MIDELIKVSKDIDKAKEILSAEVYRLDDLMFKGNSVSTESYYSIKVALYALNNIYL